MAPVAIRTCFLPPLDPARPVSFWAGSLTDSLVRSHLHAGLEVTVAVEGRLEVSTGGYRSILQPGQVNLQALWEPHSWRARNPPIRIAVFTFSAEAVDDHLIPDRPWTSMFAALPERRPRLEASEARRRVLSEVMGLHREVAEERRNRHAVVRLELLRLLVELERSWRVPLDEETGGELGDVLLDRIRPALDLVYARPRRAPRLREAAQACGLGLTRFNALFSQAVGTSFARFCLRVRMGAVTHRLLTSRLPVEAIAEETGFADASHLHRHFVRLFGATPAEYRKHQAVVPHLAFAQGLGMLLLSADTQAPDTGDSEAPASPSRS